MTTFADILRQQYDAARRSDVPGSAVETSDEAESDVSDGLSFDPADFTVAEVLDYLEEHPEDAAAVRAAEEAGENRSTLIAALDD